MNQQTLKDIYQLNSDMNRITAQLKAMNDNPERYQSDLETLSTNYLQQLHDKAQELIEITNLPTTTA